MAARGCVCKGVWPGGEGGGKKILNGMLYIKMVKIKNVVQWGVWLGCGGWGVVGRGCGYKEVWPIRRG